MIETKAEQITRRQLKLQEEYPTARLIVGFSNWEKNGFPQELFDDACSQVSQMITGYNTEHPNEMLPKSEEIIATQMKEGHSIMIAHRENGHAEVMCHGTIYPAFENGEERILGMQVVEIGSLIVHPDYRRHGMGSLGNMLLLELTEQYPNSVALATIKQSNTAWAFKNAGAVPVSFWEYPYLSYLTCTCSHCSEREGHQMCDYRRSPEESSIIKLNEILDRQSPPQKIPCTLVMADTERAHEFEQKCLDLHHKLTGKSFESATPGTMYATMAEIDNFFALLRTEAADAK